MSACMSVCQSDEDYETYDTILELDEILNLDSDAERTGYIHVINHFLNCYLFFMYYHVSFMYHSYPHRGIFFAVPFSITFIILFPFL